MHIRNIEWPDDQEAVFDFLSQTQDSAAVELAAAWYNTSPLFKPADTLLYEDQGTIVGLVLLIPRQIQIGNSRLSASELALVEMLPPYEKRGALDELLAAAHARLDSRGDALGLWVGSPNTLERWHYEYAVGLYLTSYESTLATERALNAGQWSAEHAYERRTAERLGICNQDVTVRRFTLSDLPAVHALYEAESALGHYLIARDEQTWRWQLDYLARLGRYDPDDFLVAEVDGCLTAYLRLITREPINWFLELDASPVSIIEAAGTHPDSIEKLLYEAACTAQALDRPSLGLFVHPDSTLMRHALAHGGTLRAATGAAFMRLHALALALEQLFPTLEARRLNSCYAGRAYDLVITTEAEQVVVPLGEGQPEVVELEIPAVLMLRLITGWYGLDHLQAGYLERYADLLRVLFPRRDPKIAFTDMI